MFTAIFLSFLAATLVTRLWLGHRQSTHIAAHYDRVPAAFAERISLEDHHRAANYSQARLRLGRVTLAWETLWLLLWTLGGGIALLDAAWRGAGLGPIATGIAVIFSLVLASSLLNLPFSLYQTFVIEERFGFNQTTLGTWVSDLLKSALLVVMIGAPLLAAILWLMNRAGGSWWIYAWLTWMAFNLLMIWAYPVFIAPLFNRFTPLEDASLRERIEALLRRCGFHSQGVFVVDGSRRTAMPISPASAGINVSCSSIPCWKACPPTRSKRCSPTNSGISSATTSASRWRCPARSRWADSRCWPG